MRRGCWDGVGTGRGEGAATRPGQWREKAWGVFQPHQFGWEPKPGHCLCRPLSEPFAEVGSSAEPCGQLRLTHSTQPRGRVPCPRIGPSNAPFRGGLWSWSQAKGCADSGSPVEAKWFSNSWTLSWLSAKNPTCGRVSLCGVCEMAVFLKRLTNLHLAFLAQDPRDIDFSCELWPPGSSK